MTEKVIRAPVYKYIKSGKISAIHDIAGAKGRSVIDLYPDLRGIEKVRSVNYIKRDTLTHTKYTLEAVEIISKGTGLEFMCSYKFLRILTPDDLNLDRWRNAKSLYELPVGSHDHISHEERIWAGEVEGNTTDGVFLLIATLISWLILTTAKGDFSVLLALVTVSLTYFLIKFKWIRKQEASPSKLEELRSHKTKLRNGYANKIESTKSALDKMLEDYANWERLTPFQFEHALCLKLQKVGYQLSVTKYSGDGGVDLEGFDVDGNPVLIQAKKYSSNVGVSVVREMIGVRESNRNKATTIIYALVGFTKGAIDLAEREGVILKSIKNDILGH